MRSARKSAEQENVEPLEPVAPSGEAAAQRLWPLIAVVIVIGGMALGYVLFT